jgi:hydrogenase-4 component B
MQLLLIAILLLLGGGGLALFLCRFRRWSGAVAIGSVLLASALGITAAIRVLAGPSQESIRLPWSFPFGSFYVGLDWLSAFFVLPVLILASCGVIYGVAYLGGKETARSRGVSWFMYNLLVASMLLVISAKNGVLFLMAWEIMSVASFILVMSDDRKPDVHRAGWTYLVASHVGTASLLVLFLLLGRDTPALDFGAPWAGGGGTRLASLVFLLAVVGFGTKAGFVPLHVWLPEAHPAAPSHVSALMSGVMIKMGVYGLMRVLLIVTPLQPWWGWMLVGLGVVSGILGVLFALAQHDLKRLLAYHSVENIGIITLGMGIGLLGRYYGSTAIALLGFGGALWHVFNHALFKGLLFLAAGSVAGGSGTREIDRLGGLLKRMPWTGLSFLIGSVAICGLPPLNGFISELLIYLSAFAAVGSASDSLRIAGILVITALGLIGGLATACFTKAFGIVFLGEPRSEQAAQAHEAPGAMRAAMMILAIGCVAVGFLAPFIFKAARDLLGAVAGGSGALGDPAVEGAARSLRMVAIVGSGLTVLVAVLALIRRRLLAHRCVTTGPTWDCGYAAPATRMQYTSSSYARPLTGLFGFALRTRRTDQRPAGFFPKGGALHTVTPDLLQERVYAPAFRSMERLLSRFRWLQGGRTQLYVLYIALTLLFLLIWKLGPVR